MKEQYQLWIMDGARGKDAKPISAGVFDVKPNGTALVRVNSSLHIGEATAFAISQEPPGGLVQPTKVVMLIPPKVG
jgi:anti-sigma-K factor RskA